MQHMPVFFYAGVEPAEPTREAVLAFTRGDHYKPLAGYKVLSHHYHIDLGQRLVAAGTADVEIEDYSPLKAAGINIIGTAERVRNGWQQLARGGPQAEAAPARGGPASLGHRLPGHAE